jgi:hypothetical protein
VVRTEKVRVGVSGLCVLVFLIVCVVFLDRAYFVFDLRRHSERARFSATRDLLLFFFLAGGGWPSLGRGTSVHHKHD